MKIIALIEKNKVENTFDIFTPEIESTIYGSGKSVAEAKMDFEAVAKDTLPILAENYQNSEYLTAEFIYKYDVASVFNYFDFLNVSKFAKWAGINAALMRQYKTSDVYISEKQAKKIEDALHKVAAELSAISL